LGIFAFYELQKFLQSLIMTDDLNRLAVMVEGKRLEHISDLPLDWTA